VQTVCEKTGGGRGDLATKVKEGKKERNEAQKKGKEVETNIGPERVQYSENVSSRTKRR